MELDVLVHRDQDAMAYWAHIPELPGCFAAGHTYEELEESLDEAVSLYLETESRSGVLASDRVVAMNRYRYSEDLDLGPG